MHKKNAATAAALLLAASAWAQQATPLPPMTAPAKPSFAIRGFDITGANPLAASDSSRVLAPYLRQDATIDTLQAATAALEAELKAKGYVLHRVVLPPQDVGETVKLRIVTFSLGKVIVEGNKDYSEANIRASVPELREGTAPNFRTLSVQTTIANESAGKQVQVALKESETPDQIDARVVVTESKPWSFAISEANTGSRATGRDRLSFSGSHANVFGMDHQFTGALTTSLEKGFDDVRQFGANYRIPVYRWGGVLGLSYTRSTVVGDFGTLTSTGAGQTMGVNYSHYLPPDGGERTWITVGYDDKRFDVTKLADLPIPGQFTRRTRPFSLGLSTRVESDDAIWGASITLFVNTSGGGGNNLVAYRSEDPRITSTNFKTLRSDLNYLRGFGGGWLFSARAQMQYSPDALISGEQFGLGGASSIRGTDERPISGDTGLLGSLEVSTPAVLPGLRLHGFVDAGRVTSHGAGANPNKPAKDHLASMGLGLRYQTQMVGITAEWGRLVTGSVLGRLNPTMPRAGDNKLHLSASVRF